MKIAGCILGCSTLWSFCRSRMTSWKWVSDPQAIKETKDAQTPAITRESLLGENSQPLIFPGMSLWPNMPYANLSLPIPYATVPYPAMEGDWVSNNYNPATVLPYTINKVPIYEKTGWLCMMETLFSNPSLKKSQVRSI